MAQKIAIGIVLIFGLFATSCSDQAAEGVSVRFDNQTGYKLDKLTIGNKVIGQLAPDQQTVYLPYPEFGFDTGMPDEPLEAWIGNNAVGDFSSFYWCGTEKTTVTEGRYQITLIALEQDGQVYIQMQSK